MRVLLIDVNCKQGSTGKIVYDLYSHLIMNGEEAAVCYGRGPRIKEKNIFKFGLDWETYLHAFLTRITGFTGCFSHFSTKRLIKFIKRFKPDVVHIHELHAYFVNIVQLIVFLKKQNIKVVHTLHCEFSYTGKCGHSNHCTKWQTECGNCPKIRDYVSTLFFDRTKHMFNRKKIAFTGFNDFTVVAPSKWLADRSRLSFLGQYQIKVIHNGIDTKTFCYKRSAQVKQKYNPDGKTMILSVAPDIMSKKKGGLFLLELSKRFNDDYLFMLVGSNENQIKKIGNTIILPKIYDKDLLSEIYSLADVFVICSEKENFPTTCLEAQCCGTPVVGFDTGGVKETSVFGINRFVPYGNLDDLESCIKNTLNEIVVFDKTKMSKIAIDTYSSKVMADKYLKIYNNNL